MHSRARVLGQPLNPILTLLPLGILTTALIADLGALLSGWRIFAVLAHADMVPGLLAGVLALGALLVDLLTTPPGTPARYMQGVVCSAYGGMLVIFTAVWSLHADTAGNGVVFALEVLALTAGIASAWLARGVTIGRLPGQPAPLPEQTGRIRPRPTNVAGTIPLIRLGR